MDFRIIEQDHQPVVTWIGLGTASANDALVINKKGDCAERLLALLQDGDNDSQSIKDALGDEFTVDQTRRAVAKLRVGGKLEVIKLPGGKTIWRRVNAQVAPQCA